MRSIAALLTLLTLLVACGENPVPTGPVSVTGDGYRGVLLPASAWPDYAYEVEGFFDPATGQFTELFVHGEA